MLTNPSPRCVLSNQEDGASVEVIRAPAVCVETDNRRRGGSGLSRRYLFILSLFSRTLVFSVVLNDTHSSHHDMPGHTPILALCALYPLHRTDTRTPGHRRLPCRAWCIRTRIYILSVSDPLTDR